MTTKLFLSQNQILACSFEQWYPKFRSLRSTFPSAYIPLDARFITYLRKDGIRLPKAPVALVDLKPSDPRRLAAVDDDEWEEEEDCRDTDEEEESFEELETNINRALEELGNSVFPKLNWTHPRDALFMNSESSKCCSPGEIFLLLKSSDFCQHDLNKLEQLNNQPYLVLRKFIAINPAFEFRCFVRNGTFLYACQRDVSIFYKFLTKLETKQQLQGLLENFVTHILIPNFDQGGGSGFIADVYVEYSKKRSDGR